MKTLIAVPSHDYMLADTCRCLMELDRPENTAFAMITGTLIFEARNTIAARAVQEGFDRVMWIDSDMVFKRNVLRLLLADMDSEGLDFVTGLYFTRHDHCAPVIYNELTWKIENKTVQTSYTIYKNYPRDSLFEIQGSGFGCCLTSARLLKDLIEKRGQPFWPMMGMGEDMTFCFLAREAGYKLWCDSRVKFGHIGKREYDELEYMEG